MFFFLHVFLGAGVVGVLGKHTFFFSSWGGGQVFFYWEEIATRFVQFLCSPLVF